MKLFFLISLLCCFVIFTNAQTENDKVILSKLEKVKEGQTLETQKAWMFDKNHVKVGYDLFKDKWLLIDFWATGCKPCVEEFPVLSEFYERNKHKIQVIAVSVDSKFDTYLKSAKKYKLKVPHFHGGYTYDNDIFNLNIKANRTSKGEYTFRTEVPQYVLIDPKGKIIDKDFPKPSSFAFRKELEKQIGKLTN